MATSQQRQQLAKERKKKQQQIERRRNILVRHYTKQHWIEKIFSEGELKLEGSNITIEQPGYRILMYQYKLVRRYLWFSESHEDSIVAQQRAIGFSSENLPYFEFRADSIDIHKWSDVRDLFTGTSLSFAKQLDRTAIEDGSDPTKWWVSKQPVLISQSLRFVKGSDLAE